MQGLLLPLLENVMYDMSKDYEMCFSVGLGLSYFCLLTRKSSSALPVLSIKAVECFHNAMNSNVSVNN